MVTSKRIQNAKSERHYRATGPMAKKKQPSPWKVLRKQLAAHPYVIGFLMLMLVTSGIATFFMSGSAGRWMVGHTETYDTFDADVDELDPLLATDD